MPSQQSPIGSHMEPPAPARIRYVGGPRDDREDVLDVPGGVPTILAVEEPVGYYVRDDLPGDGRWQMRWRGFGEVAAGGAEPPNVD